MLKKIVTLAGRRIKLWATFNGAILFYTSLPLPASWPVRFEGVVRWAPSVGLLIGGLLAAVDGGLGQGAMPIEVRSTVVILTGIAIAGGLHLDGAMDTADGLAVQSPERRLTVMADSHTGAFGVMVAIAILLLKTMALAALDHDRWFALLAAASWGRWGQQWAVAIYPYLKATGKGAMHKAALPSGWHTLPSACLLTGLGLVLAAIGWIPWLTVVVTVSIGVGTAMALAAWLTHKLGGHTGDTYGAMVEWIEAAILVGLSTLP